MALMSMLRRMTESTVGTPSKRGCSNPCITILCISSQSSMSILQNRGSDPV